MRLRKMALAGAAALSYAAWETRAYRLREREISVPVRAPSLSILHITDAHLTERNRKLRTWLGALPSNLERVHDIAIATGDMIDDDSGIEPLAEALAGLRGRLGSFYIFGSHDYFQSTPYGALKSMMHRYSGARKPRTARYADSDRLRTSLTEAGWTSLNNNTALVEHSGRRIRIAGVDDSILNLHSTAHILRESDDDLAIGLVHAPDMVSEWILSGFDLVLAGHTHGGQVRLPVAGAFVTNCTLPSALAGGAHRVGAGWLHISPGLGTSKYSPIRFLCPPEVTLLHLAPG